MSDSPISHLAVQPDLIAPKNETGAVDPSIIFLTYLSFLGDGCKTAAALNVSALYVDEMAKREGWPAKVQSLLALKKDQGADALARELNRTVNFVQAVRLRNVIDRTLTELMNDDAKFEDLLTERGAKVDNFSAKAVLDLVKAAEGVQRMTYQALGDSLTEREAQEGGEKNISLSVIRALAMANVADPTQGARKMLVDKEAKKDPDVG